MQIVVPNCCSHKSLRNPNQSKSFLCICWKHRLPMTSLYIMFRYYMILYNDWFIDVIILSLSFALWISPPRSCWQEGGGPAALGLRPMQQPSLRQTQAVLLLGWKGLIAHITSIWSPWITNLHIMFDHVCYFVDLSCTSVYRGVAKIELCDGVCCFSTSPHIWNCMKLPFLGWLESFCPERLFEHELPRCSRIPCMLGNSENALWCIAGISMNFYGSPGGCISLPCISSSIEQRFFLRWKEYEERGTGKRARKRNNWKFSWLRKRRKHFRVSVDDKSLRKQLA